mmetsp:Transcript_70176/g.177954  ORF Transcript_70176/g.177954 Transcript_70176/m.177954 type:complete len:395 (+) Transcript_70176:128-1312(+)
MAPGERGGAATALALQLLPVMLAVTALTTKGEASTSVAPSLFVAQSLLQRLGAAFVRPVVYWFFHSQRLFGWAYVLPILLVKRPLRTLLGLAAYGAIHRQRWWQVAIHTLLGYGASRRHKVVSPSRYLIDDNKRYLVCLHPHSILADGWHSLTARAIESFEDGGNGPPGLGRKVALCFAPVIQHVPVHQEMYRDKCGAADKASLVKWWKTPDIDPALIPGGFAEAVFANAGDKKHEYSYIKDRKGFVRICLEERKDIMPCYTFKSSWMYWNPGILKGLRARISQKLSISLVAIIGRFGTLMPLRDDTTTVVFPPFKVCRYTVDQLDEAHSAYLDHLKHYFDVYKTEYGMGETELVFVGADFQDDDPVARALRRIGILSDQVTKNKKPRKKELKA